MHLIEQVLHDLIALGPIMHAFLHLLESHVEHVVMMQLAELRIAGRFFPQAVQKVNVFPAHTWPMGAKLVLMPGAILADDHQRETRTRLGQPFPRVAWPLSL